MRCLVLGGTGMLGRAVVAEARARGWAALGLSHAQGDLTDRDGLLGWAASFRPEVVVNCAAYTRVDAAETDRERAFAVNGGGVAHAAALAERAGARLVHVSTDYVFDGAVGRPRAPYREEAPTAPLSVYGESKLEGERRALAYDRSLVVRTSWLFGPGGASFVATMVGLIEAGRLPLRVVADQEGCPTSTPSLARALLDLAAREASGIVHYQDREPVSWYAFAVEIARLWSGAVEVVPVTSAEFPRPARRPAYSVLDVGRFETIAGRRVEPWTCGLVETLAWLKKERNR
jgi:dTDP-4-dehydrorhamnose reductase